MQVVESLSELADQGVDCVALTCGVFDGLHRGHQALIEHTLVCARVHQAAPVMLTFRPHPAKVLCPEKAPPLLMSPAHKRRLAAEFGIQHVVELLFSREVAAIEPESFLRHMLEADLRVASICVGEHWRFGYRARGDFRMLSEFGKQHGIETIAVPELLDGGNPISSTRVRAALREGKLQTAERLLGRPFSISGPIAHGKGIGGSELHYPTANIAPANELFPPSGIYAARARLTEQADGIWLNGILYLGNSPTFVDEVPETPFVEMHIFDFDQDIYGKVMEVELLAFIRPDARFESADALCQQIALDIKDAILIHQGRKA